MLATLAGIIIFLSFVSERIFASDGLGYDGGVYGYIAIRFQDYLHGEFKELLLPGNAFYNRFLLSALCHYTLQVLGADLNTPNVITFFRIYEAIVLFGTGLLWCSVSDFLGLGHRGKWWGFLGLFGNYAVLKYAFYYPVLMDVSALFLGLALLHCYLTRRNILLATTIGISFFVWPMATLMGLLLLMAPRSEPSYAPPQIDRTYTIISVIAVALLLVPKLLPPATMTSAPTFRSALPLSVAIVACYLFVAFRSLLPRLLSAVMDCARDKNFLLRCLALIGLALLLPLFSTIFSPLKALSMATTYFSSMINNSINRPAESFVAIILYFGPIMIFAAYFFRPFLHQCRSFGAGYFFVMLLLVFQSLNPLSRQMIAGLPFFIVPIAMVLDRVSFPSGFVNFFVAASLLISKVWMLNNIGIDTSLPGEGNPTYWTRYTSSTGWWMTDEAYLIQAVLCIVGVLLLIIYLNGRNIRESEPGTPH